MARTEIAVGVAALGLCLALTVVIVYQDFRAGKLRTKVAEYETAVETFKRVNDKNQKEIAECKATAKQNIAEAEKRFDNAYRLAVESEEDRAALEAQLKETVGHVIELQGECPAADDPRFIDFVCSGPIGCTRSGGD